MAGALTLAGVLARLASLSSRTGGHLDAVLYPDERNYYLDAARRLAAEGPAFFLTERSLWTGPVNPVWIWVLRGDLAAVRVANVLLLAAAGLLVWRIARRQFGEAAGLSALVLVTASPGLGTFGPTALTEAPFIALLVLAVWAWQRGTSAAWALTAGAAAGVAALTRSALLPWPAALLGAGAVSTWRCGPAGRDALRRAGWVALAFAAVTAPWIAKNALVLGRPVVANGLGAVLYLGTDFRTGGDEPIYAGLDFDTWRITRPYSHFDTEGDRRLLALGLERARSHPLAYARLCLEKAWKYLLGSPEAYWYPARTWAHALRTPSAAWGTLELVVTALTVVLGAVGLARAGGALALRVACASLGAWFVALHSATFAIPRLALPLHPLLAIYAGAVATASAGAARARTVAIVAAALAAVGVATWNTGRVWWLVPDAYPGYFDIARDAAVTPAAQRAEVSFPPLPAEPQQLLFLTVLAPPRRDAAPGGTGAVRWRSGRDGREGTATFELVRDARPRVYRVPVWHHPSWSGVVQSIHVELPDGAALERVRVAR